MQTQFAPAERADPETLDRQVEIFRGISLLSEFGDAIPTPVAILNPQRQLVFANKRLLDMAGGTTWEQAKGKRPGELLDCVHSTESDAGCGTTEFCTTCGGVNAVLNAQKGTQSVLECRITTNSGKALELMTWATPYEHNGDRFTIFALEDISTEKRKQALERTFFHDISNTVFVISGFSGLMTKGQDQTKMMDLAKKVARASDRLVGELQSQRQLLEAERGELEISSDTVHSGTILQEAAGLYADQKLTENRTITVDPESEDIEFGTDPVLLGRIVGNMVKNALEATAEDGTVLLSCSTGPDTVTFSVNNPTHMPRNTQLQVFQRSFSTKGVGRGIGTYGMKLFGEHYLGGSVRFTSSEAEGTTFCVELPRQEVTCQRGHRQANAVHPPA